MEETMQEKMEREIREGMDKLYSERAGSFIQ